MTERCSRRDSHHVAKSKAVHSPTVLGFLFLTHTPECEGFLPGQWKSVGFEPLTGVVKGRGRGAPAWVGTQPKLGAYLGVKPTFSYG